MSIEAMKQLVHEMEYVLSCINANKMPFDGDDFHEALRLGREAIAAAEKERCVGCEACIDTACGRKDCPKSWPKADKQEPDDLTIAYMSGVYDGKNKYSPQRQWVGIDQEEIKKASLKAGMQEHYMDFHSGFIRFADEIEATLRSKNT